jgi:hypothetical protein
MIYLINFSIFVFYCLDNFLFAENKRGYWLKWRLAYANLNLLLYNRLTKKEEPRDNYGCPDYNMKSVAVKYKDIHVMRKYIIPVIERYLEKKKRKGIKEVDCECVERELKIPRKYIDNYFESSQVIVLEYWNSKRRHTKGSCYYYNAFDLFFLCASNKLANWWLNRKYVHV